MKRQVASVRRSSSELDEPETNDSKRIKLLNNGADLGNFQVDNLESVEMHHNNGSCNKEDQSSQISTNGSTYEISMPKLSSETNRSFEENLSVNENGIADDKTAVNNNCNGPNGDKVILEVISSDSGVNSEMHSDYLHSNSNTNEIQITDNKGSVSGHTNYAYPPDLQNSESTDSFQSENCETINCITSKNQSLESNSSQEKEESHTQFKKNTNLCKSIDVDNLTMSHLEVSQLEGHPDVIFCVDVDEDFILSSSGDTTVKVWNIEDHRIISNFSGHKDSVTSVILLSQKQTNILKKKLDKPEVSRIAITGSVDCHIKVWSVTDGHEISSVYTFNGITCLGYFESESVVVVGTDGGKLELWDIASAKVLQSVRAHEDSVTDVKVKENNMYSVSLDGTVKVWVFEDNEIYPIYTRKRKEPSGNTAELGPTQWKSVAVSDNILYLGDHTSNLKVLDWRAGHLRLFKNQIKNHGVCENVTVEKDMLFSSYYDSSSDTSGINVWRIPDMSYICTLTGDVQDIYTISVMQRGNFLTIVSGGHQLLVWNFDLSKPPNKDSQDGFHVCELENVGNEIDEKFTSIGNAQVASPRRTLISNEDKNSSNKWCNVM